MISSSARVFALEILGRSRRKEAFVGELIDQALQRSTLPPTERTLLTQLVNGVLRRRWTLDALIGPFTQRGLAAVEPLIIDILHLGAFQLAFLTRIPAYAAVDESVKLAEAVQPRAKGFVNGVLRRVAEVLTDEFVDAPAADTLPLDDGRFRRLSRPLFPDPTTAPIEYVAAGYSLPDWLVADWLRRMDFAEACRWGAWFASPPPLWLRVNPLRTTRSAYLDLLRDRAIPAEPGELPESIRLVEHHSVRDLPGFEAGLCSVQDESAQHVAALLDPQPGWSILDLCAAPGSKTTHLAERMRNRGRIVAADTDARRLRPLPENCRRLGISIIETRTLGIYEPSPAEGFDAVLVDVPCSNTGVLGRRPEVRLRLQQRDFPHLIALQERLLRTALAVVKSGGVVLYSTCSTEPGENGELVRRVIAEIRGVRQEAEIVAVPGRPADGGYRTRLRRT